MCLTLVLDGLALFCSAHRAFKAASQSNTERVERALKGDLALSGESRFEIAGLGGSLMLGKVIGPVRGADMGTISLKGLGGMIGAVAGGAARLLPQLDVGDDCSLFEEHSDRSLVAVAGAESGVVSPDAMVGEPRDIALERKSV